MRRLLMILATLLLLAFTGTASAQESIADAARKARESKKSEPKAKRVFTNDTVPSAPTAGGNAPAPAAASAPASGAADAAADTASKDKNDDPTGEKGWRARFAEARKNLADAEKELDILQRELNLNSQQYYSDPTKALNEQFGRGEINEQRKKIENKKKEVAALRQAIADLEGELRQAGKPLGWSRP